MDCKSLARESGYTHGLACACWYKPKVALLWIPETRLDFPFISSIHSASRLEFQSFQNK